MRDGRAARARLRHRDVRGRGPIGRERVGIHTIAGIGAADLCLELEGVSQRLRLGRQGDAPMSKERERR
jgi:hypothetical protein